jgi:hypothetical protein
MRTPQFLHPLDPLAPSTATAAQPVSAMGGARPLWGALAGFSMEIQQHDNWCWAAVSVSVANFYGTTNWSQCDLAAKELNLDCCGADGPVQGNGGCNRDWHLDTPLSRVGHFDRMSSSSAAFALVCGEINLHRTLCARVAWNGGGAHYVALGGWSIDATGTEFVDVYDPYYDFSQIPYSKFVSSYQPVGNAWTHSYFTCATMPPVAGSPSPAPNSPTSA